MAGGTLRRESLDCDRISPVMASTRLKGEKSWASMTRLLSVMWVTPVTCHTRDSCDTCHAPHAACDTPG